MRSGEETGLPLANNRCACSKRSGRVPAKKIQVAPDKSNAEVMEWVSQNRGLFRRNTGRTVDPTIRYVSAYVGETIFVHVLDWAGGGISK